jgi:hypothetical protein
VSEIVARMLTQPSSTRRSAVKSISSDIVADAREPADVSRRGPDRGLLQRRVTVF